MAVTLSVTGMTCSHCAGSVAKALKAVAGVDKVSVSLEQGRAEVEGNASAATLIRAVEEEGYQARVAGA